MPRMPPSLRNPWSPMSSTRGRRPTKLAQVSKICPRLGRLPQAQEILRKQGRREKYFKPHRHFRTAQCFAENGHRNSESEWPCEIPEGNKLWIRPIYPAARLQIHPFQTRGSLQGLGGSQFTGSPVQFVQEKRKRTLTAPGQDSFVLDDYFARLHHPQWLWALDQESFFLLRSRWQLFWSKGVSQGVKYIANSWLARKKLLQGQKRELDQFSCDWPSQRLFHNYATMRTKLFVQINLIHLNGYTNHSSTFVLLHLQLRGNNNGPTSFLDNSDHL